MRTGVDLLEYLLLEVDGMDFNRWGGGKRASRHRGEWSTGQGPWRRGHAFDFVFLSYATIFCHLSLSLLRNMGNASLENES